MGRYAALAVAIALLCAAPRASSAQTTAPDSLQVAFTFDDLPAHGPLPPGEARPAVVKSILATLKAENMPPVYGFVNGFRLAKYPYQIEILRAWHAAGEPMGNHTYSHPGLDNVSAEKFEADIAKNEAILRKVDPGGDWRWFRFPYLNEGDTLEKRQQVRQFLFARGYKIAEVSMDFEDYMWNDAYGRCAVKHDNAAILSLEQSYLDTADHFITVFRNLSQKLYGRDIPYVLLLHVGAFDARMLPRLIELFRSRGFTFVTLPQAQSDPAYSFDPNIGYPGGGTFQELVSHVKGVNFPDDKYPDKQLDAMCR